MYTTLKETDAIHGGFGKPSKMPGLSYGIPAQYCKVGAKLQKVKGSVCSDCYALKGRYVFPNVRNAMERRYQSLQHPEWVDAVVWSLKRKKVEFFRWHDSGDLQGMWHLQNIAEVAVRCPEISFWLPTRENALVTRYLNEIGPFPKNLVVRVSGAMIDGYTPIKFMNVSSVRSKGLADSTAFTCSAPQNGGECGSCRACWNPHIREVSYLRH